MNKKYLYGDKFFHLISLLSAVSILVIIAGIVISLFIDSLPAIEKLGFFNFIFTKDWNYSEEIFGGAKPLTGTIITSVIALSIAVPVGVGIAIFINEVCPKIIQGTVSTLIELLAAIPSIIYGMWGFFVFAPFVEKTIQVWLSSAFENIPVLNTLFHVNSSGGIGLFTAGLVLSIMVIPFIASISGEALKRVPLELKEAAYGMGAGKWEVISDVSLKYSASAIQGGVIIALGRALGETMAIAYIIGNITDISLSSIFDPYVTVTSVLVNEFNEASGLQMSSLFMLAFLLFILNFSLLAAAKYYVGRKV